MESQGDDNPSTSPVSTPKGPTDSHILSQIEPDEKGSSQRAGDSKTITDIGWDMPAEHINEPLIAGLSNEDLWMLIRRFDKQVYNVKAVPDTDSPLQNLDLTRTDDDDFTPDKLRATIERFYTSVFLSLASFVKHVARLRSWKEPRRTAIFCFLYFVAWALDFLVAGFFLALIALVIYPPCRPVLFPPAPIALVNKDTGGIQRPEAGVLGSHDSITGAPENFKGEAAEQEASNLVASVASVAVGSAVGKHEEGVSESAPLEKAVPDAMDVVANSADAQSAASGEIPSDTHDKTRQPMKESVMKAASMAMQQINDVTDIFEKLTNALSATPPFPQWVPRLRLASILIPSFLASLSMSSYEVLKGFELFAGLAFFGNPIFVHGFDLLNRKYPNWHKVLQIQNSLLKGVPTHAQLTLTLLRIGEANASPLPPPPSSRNQPPSRPASLRAEELELGASTEEIKEAASKDPTKSPEDEHDHPNAPKKNSLASGIIHLFRGTTATGVESKRGFDRVRATIGSRHAKSRVGVLRPKGKVITPAGPSKFHARYKGKRGSVIIDSTSDQRMLYFTTDSPHDDDIQLENRKKGSVLFEIPITDIRGLKKLGGIGWKSKLVVGWAMGSKEVIDGLLIVGKDPGQSFQLTAMSTRNQLFNRLLAINGQVWR